MIWGWWYYATQTLLTSGKWPSGSPQTPPKAKLLDNGHVSKNFCLMMTSQNHHSMVLENIGLVLESRNQWSQTFLFTRFPSLFMSESGKDVVDTNVLTASFLSERK